MYAPSRLIQTHLAMAAVLFLAAPALADLKQREAAAKTLESLPAKDSGIDLQVRIDGGGAEGVRVGDQIAYHFETKKDAYLTAVFLDAHGVLTVLYPSLATGDNLLSAGQTKIFPAPDSGFELKVEPPLGLEDLYAVATLDPITPADLGLSLSDDQPAAIIEADQAEAFAKRLHERLERSGASRVAWAHLQQRVRGRDDADQYTPEDVVAYFTQRTRSIRRPKLSMNITFATGSSELDTNARRNLDSIGRALADRRMTQYTFTVGGHTDDTGGEDLNMELSESRAAAVRDYLSGEHGVNSGRLDVRGFGESSPLEPNTSETARSANRRVEFQLQR